MASRPRSAPRRSLGAGPGDAAGPSGLLSAPGVGFTRAGGALRAFPAGFARKPSASIGPGRPGTRGACGTAKGVSLCLSSHHAVSESERAGPGPESHCGASLTPRQAAPLPIEVAGHRSRARLRPKVSKKPLWRPESFWHPSVLCLSWGQCPGETEDGLNPAGLPYKAQASRCIIKVTAHLGMRGVTW